MPSVPSRPLRRSTLALVAATAVLAPFAPAASAAPAPLAERLTRAVSAENINRHLIALQRIADRNNGNRATHTAGYQQSLDYIAGKLRTAGFDVKTPDFSYNREVADAAVVTAGSVRIRPHQLNAVTDTPVGGITGPLAVVPVDATSGCEASDYAGINAVGAIALIRRGGCTFAQKQRVAADQGALVALVYNNVVGPGIGSVDPALARIPTAGMTMAEGATLAAMAGTPTTVDLRNHDELTTSRYVVAQTRTGRTDNVVMAGSQVDSIDNSPGINDTGAGAGALLELAVQLGSTPRVPNAVRFAWWGAEANTTAAGAYLRSLTFEQQLDIALYLNSNSLASVNAGYFLLDGDNSGGFGPMPYGSAQLEKTLADYLGGRGIPTEDTNFDRGWDHSEYIAAGIPTGGLYAGSFRAKTAAQAAKWGGTAGVSFDPCHQQPCDNLGNVDRTVLERNADALAFATGTYATSTEDVNGVPSRAQRLAARAASRSAAATTAGGTE